MKWHDQDYTSGQGYSRDQNKIFNSDFNTFLLRYVQRLFPQCTGRYMTYMYNIARGKTGIQSSLHRSSPALFWTFLSAVDVSTVEASLSFLTQVKHHLLWPAISAPSKGSSVAPTLVSDVISKWPTGIEVRSVWIPVSASWTMLPSEWSGRLRRWPSGSTETTADNQPRFSFLSFPSSVFCFISQENDQGFSALRAFSKPVVYTSTFSQWTHREFGVRFSVREQITRWQDKSHIGKDLYATKIFSLILWAKGRYWRILNSSELWFLF